jgi:hypothetical protein
MEVTNLAYLAGLIDGEGTVEARIDSRHETWLSIRISIANSNHTVIDWLKITFGGNVCPRKTYKAHHLPQKAWSVSGLAAIEIAKATLPYAIIKKEQLEVLVQLERLRGLYQKGFIGPRVSPEMVQERRPLVDRLIVLNRRGSSQWVNRPSWRRLRVESEMNEALRQEANVAQEWDS